MESDLKDCVLSSDDNDGDEGKIDESDCGRVLTGDGGDNMVRIDRIVLHSSFSNIL